MGNLQCGTCSVEPAVWTCRVEPPVLSRKCGALEAGGVGLRLNRWRLDTAP